VQVNGTLRGSLGLERTATEATIREQALALPNVVRQREGKTVKKVIVVPGKIVNVVIA
jgi:leucyl-tRNA synthetase